MSSAEGTQPGRRGPGRPPKTAPKPAENQPETPDASKQQPEKKSFPGDERIGRTVDDSRWTTIGFHDGQVYRVDNGVIVERIS